MLLRKTDPDFANDMQRLITDIDKILARSSGIWRPEPGSLPGIGKARALAPLSALEQKTVVGTRPPLDAGARDSPPPRPSF